MTAVVRLAFGLLCAALAFGPARAADPIVFAAASLKNALDAVAADYKRDTGKSVAISYAGSNALARQIEAGAPASVFISADLDWMDYVEKRSLLAPGSRANLLRNRLVLIGPKDAKPIAIAPGFNLKGALGGQRLAMANVEAVPAGKYGKEALEKLGVWQAVSGSVAQAENVRAALVLVSRGEAPLGIVYQTDAAADPNVTIVGTFPENTHPPIVYPAALTKSADADAKAFLERIRSKAARPAFEKQGFSIVE